MGKWTRFSEEDISYIRNNYKSSTNKEIAGHLGRSDKVISLKIASLGLKRDPKVSKIHRPTYSSWACMITRCENKNRDSWARYGGRGISVCERWRNSFWNFVEDLGQKPDGFSIDRIDPNGNYEPSNCRWIENRFQSRTTEKFLKGGPCIDCGDARGNRKGRCHKCNEYFRRNKKQRPPVKALVGKFRQPAKCVRCEVDSLRFCWGVCKKCFHSIYKPGLKKEDAEISGLLKKKHTP